MGTLRTTVIAKTDICGFTTRVKVLSETDLSVFLNQHKQFISDIVSRSEGSIIKGEGDAFWIVFPSVTVAALAAVEMQQELRIVQSGKADDERIAIRIVITLGDVLHQDSDIFGHAVNLTARIESITPADEIYLSQAAWLVLNKSEIQASFVNEFLLKGINEPEKIYKIEQKHKTRTLKNQVLVFSDIRDFVKYQTLTSVEHVENLLVHLDDVEKKVCSDYGGVIRQIFGDGYFLTFSEASQALAAVEDLCQQWSAFVEHHQIPCGVSIGVHKGDVNIFRSCLYSQDINITAKTERLNRSIFCDRARSSVLVTGTIAREVQATPWQSKLRAIAAHTIVDSDFQTFVQEQQIYQLLSGRQEAEGRKQKRKD